ncbi:MAG TPA: tetratricopeptide repeat protein [Planctomycetaceae bacterium]|nr:tetratricopeptide repeat protein [Planctomycetaceae bacterium]
MREPLPTVKNPGTDETNPFGGAAPLEWPLNPFEAVTIPDEPPASTVPQHGPDRDPGRDALASEPVEAPQPDVAGASPDEALKKLGATLERDAAGRVVLVDLSGTQVRDADLAVLRSMSGLRQLDLSSTTISDEGLNHLSGLSELQLLALSGTGVTDAGITRLKPLRVRFLLLGFTAVSDASVETLGGMSQLEGLSLRGTRLTADGVRRLRMKLPNCRIVADAPQTPTGPANRTLPGAAPNDDGGTPPQAPPTLPVPQDQPDEGPSLRDTSARRDLVLGLPAGTTLHPGAAELSEAERQLVRIITGNLADPGTYAAIGEYLALTGRRMESLPWLRAAVQAAPAERLYRYHLARGLARAGRTQAALSHFTAAVGEPAAHYNLGVIAYQNGDLPASRRHFAEALRQYPDFSAAHAWLDRIQIEGAARTASRATTTLTAPDR